MKTNPTLYPSPQLAAGAEQNALMMFKDIAQGQVGEMSLLDYQLFASMAQLHTPCSPESLRYLEGKCYEELTEFQTALDKGSRQEALEEFGDFSWTVCAIPANLAIFGERSDVRPQLAAFVRDALQVNGINEVENWTFEGGVSLPTVRGLSRADMAPYRQTFFGVYGQRPYVTPDTKPLADKSDEVLWEQISGSLQQSRQLLTLLADHAPIDLGRDSDAIHVLCFGLADAWIVSAALLQRHHGREAVEEAIFGNILKMAGRIAAGGVAKQDRQN